MIWTWIKLLLDNCQKPVSLEPLQRVEMANDSRDNERPERIRGVVGGELVVGPSAGAPCIETGVPMGSLLERTPVELGSPVPPASAAARQPLAPEVIPTTRIPRHGHLCLLGVLVIVGLVGAGVLTLSAIHISFFRCLSASPGCRRNL